MLLRSVLFLALASCASTVDGAGRVGPDAAPLTEGEEPPDTPGDPGGEEPTEEPPGGEDQEAQLTVTPLTLELEVGASQTLRATVTSEVEPLPKVGWVSTNDAVVTVDDGLVVAIAAGTAAVRATVPGDEATIAVTVTPAEEQNVCVEDEGNNGDSCANVYQGADIWRCATSSNLDGATVSQVCRDQGSGPRWITFHVDPTDCCACDGAFDVGCCTENSGSAGCP